MTIVDLYNKGYLGIQLKPGVGYLKLEGQDEDGQPVVQIVEPDRIYQVTYLSPEEGVGLFEIDKDNSVAFRINEKIWDYTSTYTGVLN